MNLVSILGIKDHVLIYVGGIIVVISDRIRRVGNDEGTQPAQ